MSFPELSPAVQAVVRSGYGLLVLATLAGVWQHRRRFFLSERWGGYGQSSWRVDAVQNPVVFPLVMLVWFACGAALVAGYATLPAALVNLVICRYYFVQMRWSGVLRGMGAPGFMLYWLGGAVFLIELTSRHAPQLHGLALLVVQVDLAAIMLSAGIYKFTAGYPRNHGMELGMVNPQWGHWHRLYARVPPGHLLFRTLNQLAWSLEIVSGLMMLVPATRAWGGLLLAASFVFIATQIRLGSLCYVVMLACVLCFSPDSLPAALVEASVPTWLVEVPPSGAPSHPVLAAALGGGLWAYLVLLPLAHAGLFYNFYGRRSLPRALQAALERYTNFFGIIIWRVFSPDHTGFSIMVYGEEPSTGRRELVSDYDRLGSRFRHVGESIALTTLFTTLKYYPSNPRLFEERVLRYSRTLRCPTGCRPVFVYLSAQKIETGFLWRPVAEYQVDTAEGSVVERRLSDDACMRRPQVHSPLHEGVRPGSYVALNSTAS